MQEKGVFASDQNNNKIITDVLPWAKKNTFYLCLTTTRFFSNHFGNQVGCSIFDKWMESVF